MSQILKAKKFAEQAHKGHFRDDGTTPYFTHLVRGVAFLIRFGYQDNEVIICAFWLHDSIEDTPVGYGSIKTEFGEVIANVVRAVSVDTRKTRKERESEVLGGAIICSHAAIIVKLADMYDNLNDMKNWPSVWQRNYAEEKWRLFGALSLNPNFSMVPDSLVTAVRETLERLTQVSA